MDGEIEFRPATEADLATEYEVFIDAVSGLARQNGSDPPEPTDEDAAGFVRSHSHVLAHDGERSFVAVADGAVVGYTDAIVRGDTWFLSTLFIRERFQGRGVGRRLLDLCWGDGYARRITLTSSIQPISNGLYAQRGLI